MSKIRYYLVTVEFDDESSVKWKLMTDTSGINVLDRIEIETPSSVDDLRMMTCPRCGACSLYETPAPNELITCRACGYQDTVFVLS